MTNTNQAYDTFRASILRPLPNPHEEQYETPHIPKGYNDEIYEHLDDDIITEKDTTKNPNNTNTTTATTIQNMYTSLENQQDPPTYMECIGTNNNKNDNSGTTNKDSLINDTTSGTIEPDNEKEDQSEAIVKEQSASTDSTDNKHDAKEEKAISDGATCIANEYHIQEYEDDYM